MYAKELQKDFAEYCEVQHLDVMCLGCQLSYNACSTMMQGLGIYRHTNGGDISSVEGPICNRLRTEYRMVGS